MNNNTKLFGVLVAALFVFGAVGTGAQQGFSTFVQLGDWEYDIGDANVYEYCYLPGGSTGTACGIYTTNGADASDGDIYIGPGTGATEVEEGFLRIFNENGFESGSIVQDDDADEGSVIALDSDATIAFHETSNDGELSSAELASIVLAQDGGGTVVKDDIHLAESMRIDDNHDLEGVSISDLTFDILFADVDFGGSSDHDADEPLFLDVDGTGTITAGDLVLSGDGYFDLVEPGGAFLANPDLINVTANAATTESYANSTYYLVILDEQDDYYNNSYRGEDILLVRESDDPDFDGRLGEHSWVLTGPRQGEFIDEDHPFHEEEYANIGDHSDTDIDDHVVLCAMVLDSDDDPVTFMDAPFFHFGATDCDGEDPDEGDVDIAANDVLSNDLDGELTSFATDDEFNAFLFYVIDLDDDNETDAGEPLLYDADASGDISTLDLVIGEDGAFLVGPGFDHLSPLNIDVGLVITEDVADSAPTEVQFCTYHEEMEDDNGDDIWVPVALHLRSPYTHTEEGTCRDEEPVVGDFVLAGNDNVGRFLTEDQADKYEGEYAIEDDGEQPDYVLYYDDVFPSGFGPEDVVFAVPASNPTLDEESFFLGGPVVSEDNKYFETDIDDLDAFGSDDPFVLLEGDNRGGLSQADWFYLTSKASTSSPADAIDDETLILYKGGSAAEEPEAPETPETPEDPEVPETPETPEGPGTEEKPEPGFEVIALIAALGAALVLVRRRN